MTNQEKEHAPRYYSTPHAWAACSCGWQSIRYSSDLSAALAFGQHFRLSVTEVAGEGRRDV